MRIPQPLVRIAFASLFVAVLAVPHAGAMGYSLGDAATYAVLYEGTGGHNDRCVYTTDAVLPVVFPKVQ